MINKKNVLYARQLKFNYTEQRQPEEGVLDVSSAVKRMFGETP